MSTAKNQSIATKLEQLDQLLQWFESENITIETAVKKYEEALQLADELETQLNTAKNQVEVIKKKFNH